MAGLKVVWWVYVSADLKAAMRVDEMELVSADWTGAKLVDLKVHGGAAWTVFSLVEYLAALMVVLKAVSRVETMACG